MRIKTTLVSLCLIFSGLAAAGDAERRWGQFSEERKEAVAQKAAELGFDISTEEGKTAFREAMKEQRAEHAAELGFDISTEEGRQAFREARKESRQSLKDNLSELSEEERTALKEELAGMTRAERREFLNDYFGG